MKRLLILACATALAGCAVGPDYRRPEPQRATAGAFVDPGMARVDVSAPTGAWWHLFDDPVLDRLVADALTYNTDVRVASANLRQARAILSEARGARLPTTDVSAGYTRQRIGTGAAASRGVVTQPGTDAPSGFEFDFFSAGFDASYEVDLFGRVSRSIEAARADTAASAAALDAARIAVAAETARSYAQACGFASQAEVARETVRLQERTLSLTSRLREAGRGTRREVDQATVLAEQARAQVPSFEAERRAALYALAALTGRPPAEIDGAASSCTAPPRVQTVIPVGDGAALLARRPDVRQAERLLAAETARIGVATAALYPSISLAGSASLGAQRIGDLGKASSFSFSLGPLISWSFPNISIARARIRQAEASTAASLARFDGTVLTALREVEQALARYAGELERNGALGRADAAAASAAEISRLRFTTGRDSFLQLLDAERDRASARAALASSNASLSEAQVSLFKALGGGWEAEPAAASPAPATP
jgi:NodT family efflux transporter outer membrane factor (OMF) lipoprotein